MNYKKEILIACERLQEADIEISNVDTSKEECLLIFYLNETYYEIRNRLMMEHTWVIVEWSKNRNNSVPMITDDSRKLIDILNSILKCQ